MEKPTLKNIRISPQDIEQSFHENHHVLDHFIEMRLISERSDVHTPGDATRVLGLSRTRQSKEYKSTQSKFERWILSDRFPPSIVSILSLHEMGIFPKSGYSLNANPADRLAHDEVEDFDYQNRLFPLMSMFSSCGFWRGHGGNQAHSGSSLELNLKSIDNDLKKLVEKLLGKSIHVAPSNKRVCIDAFRSRFLHLLGAPFGRRTETPLSIPNQVILAFNSLEDSTSSEQEKEISIKVIKDFILAFFYVGKCKYSPPRSRGYYGVLPSSESQKTSKERADLFHKSIEASELDIELDLKAGSQIGGRGMATLTHYNLVLFRNFNEAKLLSLKSEFRDRIFEMMKLLD